MRTLKQKLKNFDTTIGSWITIPHPSIAEIMCQAGFDWLTIDMEHSSITLSQAQELIQIIELSRIPALVRVGENDPTLIKRVMDAGACGIIVPMVNTRDDALRAVAAVRYPPVGTRGVGLARAQRYGLGFKEYTKWLSHNSIVIAQIEHIQAVDNLEEILRVPGIDAIMVGPYDLSASCGFPGNFTHPNVHRALKRIMDVSRSMRMPSGFHVVQPDISELKQKMRESFTFLAFSLDSLLLGTICAESLKRARSKGRTR